MSASTENDGRRRVTVPQPIDAIDDPEHGRENRGDPVAARPGHADDGGRSIQPLPKMPEKPTLLDFYTPALPQDRAQPPAAECARWRASVPDTARRSSLACVFCTTSRWARLIRADHGYWGAQLIAPYVDEEVAWAVQHHQALRFFPDPAVGYEYPEAYVRFWGKDYVVPDYLRRAYENARQHRWYGSARAITLYDLYAFDETVTVDPAEFEDIIGRHFKPAGGRSGLRRLTHRAYVAHDDLAA